VRRACWSGSRGSSRAGSSFCENSTEGTHSKRTKLTGAMVGPFLLPEDAVGRSDLEEAV
ncbi:hypothetical protein LEMLEM_LOCUS459, partial [Lemmus lemmus]